MAAIYMWFPLIEDVYTTTPYPIEEIEGIIFTVDLSSGHMQPIPAPDELDFASTYEGAILKDVLLTSNSGDDHLDFASTYEGAVLVQILITSDSGHDQLDFGSTYEGASLISRLVTALHPEHGIMLSCDLSSSDCSMTAV